MTLLRRLVEIRFRFGHGFAALAVVALGDQRARAAVLQLKETLVRVCLLVRSAHGVVFVRADAVAAGKTVVNTGEVRLGQLRLVRLS